MRSNFDLLVLPVSIVLTCLFVFSSFESKIKQSVSFEAQLLLKLQIRNTEISLELFVMINIANQSDRNSGMCGGSQTVKNCSNYATGIWNL